ncbi:MAG TPA: sulfite exporter TauE/SafE family protein [Actinomycetota bacterium]|nr:sulfite exporter TauE/SafE family protein [Actinomycetota bacterium]
MQIDWAIVLAGAIVGFVVGMTGMGGGALMTPILVIFFGISPTAAVSSDLIAAMVMKPVGGGVHIRRKTVRWPLVKWLCVGSIPMAFAGVFIVHDMGNSAQVEELTRVFLGWTLLLASSAMVFKAWLQGRRASEARLAGHAPHEALAPFAVRMAPTVTVGLIGGLLVGLTSVGSGSIVIIALMLLYPMLRGAELVGTDLVQAIPLVAAAAFAHILVGDFELALTSSILIGSIPAVWIGARVSSRAPDGVIRPLLVFVLAASGLKLLGLPTGLLGLVLALLALVGFALWGAFDAAQHPKIQWEAIGLPKRSWVKRQLFLAPIGVGAAYAVAYFARIRPQLEALGTSVSASNVEVVTG